MASLEVALRSISRQIEPTASQKEAASRSYNHLVHLLKRRAFGDRFLVTYLSGSYRRSTALRPIRDIDIIFVIDPRQWPGALLGLKDKPNPSTVLKSFARVLRDEYKTSSTFTQKRSLRLELEHVHIDCVPAIEVPDSDLVLIGNHADESWFRSSPRRHHAALTKANTANKKLLVPLVKLLKEWNTRTSDAARMRSFVIETLAVTLFSQIRMESLENGLYLFFDFVSSFGGKGERSWPAKFGIAMDFWNDMMVPDLAATGSNVAAGIEYGQMKAFVRQAVQSRDNLRKAFGVEDENRAVEFLRAAMHL